MAERTRAKPKSKAEPESASPTSLGLPENWRQIATQLIREESGRGGVPPPDERHAFMRYSVSLLYREHERLANIANGLGLHRPNALGLIPSTDRSSSADIARALHVIHFSARMIEGIALSPDFEDGDRKYLRKAFDVCLGGSKSRYFIQAFSAAQQTVCMANNIGWDLGLDGPASALETFRAYFSEVSGPLLTETPTDEFVLRRTKLKLSGQATADALRAAAHAASIKLAIDTLWEVLEDPRSKDEQRFWFPLEKPTTRRQLGKILRDHLRTR